LDGDGKKMNKRIRLSLINRLLIDKLFINKRILICSFEYPPKGSGIANVAYNLRNEFVKAGFDVDVCSPTSPKDGTGSNIQTGSWGLIEKFGSIGSTYYWWLATKYIKKNIDNYDAILLENPLLINKIYSPKIFVTKHTTYNKYGKLVQKHAGFVLRQYYSLMRWWERKLYKKLDKRIKFTSASDDVTEEMVSLGIPEKNFIYIPNGADTDRFKPLKVKDNGVGVPYSEDKAKLRHKYGLDLNKPALLFVGRFEFQHDPIGMMKIFKRLRTLNSMVQLVCVGNGKLRYQAEAEAGDTPDVVMIPRIEYADIHEIFQACDFFFLNSIYTGQSLAMLESMAAGNIQLVPNHTEFKRIVKDAGVGLLYSEDSDYTKIAQQINRYITSIDIPKEQVKMRDYALKNISWKEVAKRYLEYFKL
jgi:1,2-diacylglycerol 3-alpha-glucosyltransferase